MNELAYKVVKDLNNLRNPIVSDDKAKGTVNDSLDSSFSLSKIQGETVTELEGFIEKNANKIVTYKEGRNDNPYEFLISAQEKQIKMQSEAIFCSRKEMDCKQRTIGKLLQTLAVCLQWESLICNENIFLLQNSIINSNAQNFDKSKLPATQENEAIDVNKAPLDKDNRESIDDNSCNSIVTSVTKSLIKNYLIKLQMIIAKNHSRINKNHQNNTNSFNNSRTIQYDVSRNDINNENVRKPRSTKRVCIVGDSKVKHVNWYDISSKTENSKVFVRSSHATVRRMTDHVKPVLRDNSDHVVFHIGTNDVPSKKARETIAKSILDLAISSKSTTCDVSISNILIRKNKHHHYIDHEKSIKPQHLNKSRLHLNKRGTSVLSSNYIREISNVFQ